jgi:hypothetical protein
MFGVDLIDFDVEKNIARFQKIKWRLNSRWPPKIIFGLESTNMHYFENAVFPRLFLSITEFQWKNFFFIQNGGLYRDGVFVIIKSPYFQKILYNQ